MTSNDPRDQRATPTEIMRERAEGLREAAQAAKTRLTEREEALARLRVQVAMLKASLNTQLETTTPSIATVLPAQPPVPAPRKEAPPRTVSLQSFAPYAAIVACAVVLELGAARRPPADAALNLIALARPSPAVVANTRPSAKGASAVIDDDRSLEALLLVHEWKLPDDKKSLGERLGGELELPGGRPSWSVERTSTHGYRVTFQPPENALPYAFEADIESRVVWPTSETQELLCADLLDQRKA